jgi:hypothetical protein
VIITLDLGLFVTSLTRNVWPALALLFLLVAVAPAIWSPQEGRRNAALAVLREFGKIISATAAAMRRNGHR